MISNSNSHCFFTREISLRNVKPARKQAFKSMVLSFRYLEINFKKP